MISIKEGAKIEGLRPEILLGLNIVDSVLSKYVMETVVTEGTGGIHMVGSLHYRGLALDIRSKSMQDSRLKVLALAECKAKLGLDFDMILENENEAEEHWHLEYQPK